METDFNRAANRQAILREGLSYLAQGALFPFGYLRSRHRPKRSRALRTLVFVHGLGANRACFYPLQLYLRAGGYDRQVAFNHGNGPSIEALGMELMEVIQREVKGGSIDLIGHSLGGLVSRIYLQKLGGDRRVDRLITLGTPHRGSELSRLLPSAFVQQLKPDGPFIRSLNELPPPKTQCLSITAGEDVMVLPRDSATCPFGESLTIHDVGHLSMLTSRPVFQEVRRALEREVEHEDPSA